MFKNDTGIIILNWYNGTEGIIEKVNSEFKIIKKKYFYFHAKKFCKSILWIYEKFY